MPKFDKATHDVIKQATRVVSNHHKELSSVGVRIDIIMAYAIEDADGEKRYPTLTQHGYPVNGIAKILGPLDRLTRGVDCQVMLDGDSWGDLSEEEQEALIDHELHHFAIQRDSDGDVVIDCQGRPKLKMRKHDRQYGFFDIIAKRHGAASAEVQQATQFIKEQGHVYFTQATFEFHDPKIEMLEPASNGS